MTHPHAMSFLPVHQIMEQSETGIQFKQNVYGRNLIRLYWLRFPSPTPTPTELNFGKLQAHSFLVHSLKQFPNVSSTDPPLTDNIIRKRPR